MRSSARSCCLCVPLRCFHCLFHKIDPCLTAALPHAQCFVLICALPAMIILQNAWYTRHREVVIVASRLAAAAAAPIWLRTGHLVVAPGYSGGWMSRFPMLFLTVRVPLHVALVVASFALTLSAGNSGRMGMRLSCAIIDVVVKTWFERSSRAHFLAMVANVKGSLKVE